MIKRLQWTKNSDPDCKYDHYEAQTPFGRILITWKGWKDQKIASLDEFPGWDWKGWAPEQNGYHPESMRDTVEAEFYRRVQECQGTQNPVAYRWRLIPYLNSAQQEPGRWMLEHLPEKIPESRAATPEQDGYEVEILSSLLPSQLAEENNIETSGVHTCSYYCERPECIRAQRDELRDRLEKLEAHWVSADYVLVPKEPTDAMMDAAEDCSNDWPRTTWKKAWSAMLAAAPLPKPLPNTRPLKEVIAEFERDPKMKEYLDKARLELAEKREARAVEDQNGPLDGWVLVPREPTYEMEIAGPPIKGVGRYTRRVLYHAMIAAAPSAPVHREERIGRVPRCHWCKRMDEMSIYWKGHEVYGDDASIAVVWKALKSADAQREDTSSSERGSTTNDDRSAD